MKALDPIRERVERIADFETNTAEKDRAQLLALVDMATSLIRDLTDPDDCHFDHHGGCQAHGYLSLEPGETCPQQDAKDWTESHAG